MARRLRLSPYLAGIRKAQDGVTAVEFGFVAPVFIILMFGAYDGAQLVYGKSLLNGAAEAAARSSSLETGNLAAADAYVARIVRPILTNVEIETSRVYYQDFSRIDQPEAFNDVNANGVCDNNENYVDENSNGTWDEDVGVDGNGGAGDVVVYTVNATYRSAFATLLIPGSTDEIRLSSKAVRKNQPFADQAAVGTDAGVCPA